MTTNRRGFFGALAGMLAAPFVAKAIVPEVNGLIFHKDSFTLVYPPINSVAYDPETGIGIRYITEWNESSDRIVGRIECMYSWPKMPEFPFDCARLVSEQRRFDPARLPA